MTITHIPPRRMISVRKLERAEIIHKYTKECAEIAELTPHQMHIVGLMLDEAARELVLFESGGNNGVD